MHIFSIVQMKKKPSLLFLSSSIAQCFKDCWQIKLICTRLVFQYVHIAHTCILNVHWWKTNFKSIWNKLEAINNLLKWDFNMAHSHTIKKLLLYTQHFQLLEETPYTKEPRSSRHSEQLFSEFLERVVCFRILLQSFTCTRWMVKVGSNRQTQLRLDLMWVLSNGVFWLSAACGNRKHFWFKKITKL